MQGSEKQITWATEIRNRIEAEVNPLMAKVPQHRADAVAKAVALIVAIDYAAFWIDNKDINLVGLVRSISTVGLRYKGLEYSDTLKVDAAGNAVYGNCR